MNLDRSERRSLDRLAALEGEIWARRLLDQLSTWDGPVQGDWPGRLEDARVLATGLSDGPKTQEALALIIHQRAKAVWIHLLMGQDIGAAPPGNDPATIER
jgi:hypothetical protein